jgi:hypothetical protein
MIRIETLLLFIVVLLCPAMSAAQSPGGFRQ